MIGHFLVESSGMIETACAPSYLAHLEEKSALLMRTFGSLRDQIYHVLR